MTKVFRNAREQKTASELGDGFNFKSNQDKKLIDFWFL